MLTDGMPKNTIPLKGGWPPRGSRALRGALYTHALRLRQCLWTSTTCRTSAHDTRSQLSPIARGRVRDAEQMGYGGRASHRKFIQSFGASEMTSTASGTRRQPAPRVACHTITCCRTQGHGIARDSRECPPWSSSTVDSSASQAVHLAFVWQPQMYFESHMLHN